jgi:hypothetical protein
MKTRILLSLTLLGLGAYFIKGSLENKEVKLKIQKTNQVSNYMTKKDKIKRRIVRREKVRQMIQTKNELDEITVELLNVVEKRNQLLGTTLKDQETFLKKASNSELALVDQLNKAEEELAGKRLEILKNLKKNKTI